MAGKRPVSPDTPVRSFPTPNIDDLVVVVDVDSRLPGYKPLDYGTPHPDQTRFPGAKLVYQAPIDNADQFVRRIYATDRADQDAYNYAIKYSSGSPGHPIYIRSYVEPRAEYTPLADGSPDAVFTDAYLVEEEMAAVEGELNSLYVRVTRVFETLPGPVLTSFETNEAGQKVTVTTQRKSSAGYSLPAASATLSPSAQAEDAGVVTEQIRTVPSIFTRKQFSAERPDLLPQKFRAAVPDVETRELVLGTAEQPVLLQGDLSASQTQQSLFVKEVARRTRTSPVYPLPITETTVTRTGQLATVTSILDDSIQTADTGPLVESSEVTDLGDGRSIKVTTTVNQVFEQPSFTRSKEDLTPQKFRAALSETVEERTIPGTAIMPLSLAGNQISKTEEQLTVDRKRVRTQERNITTADPLIEKVVTPEGQLATRTLTLSDDPQTVEPSATLIQGEIEQLGDGRSVKTEVVVPSVFDERRAVKERPDLVPQEFRGAVPTETTETVVEGTTANMPTLQAGELSRAVQRVTAQKVRTSVVSRPTANLPVSITPDDILVDNDGVIVTRVKTLASGAQTLSVSATTSGSVESLGDGLTVKTQDTKAEVFGNSAFTKTKDDLTPQKFRAAVAEEVTESTTAGTAAMPSSLGANEFEKSEQQITKFTKRTRTRARNITLSEPLVEKVITNDGQLATRRLTLSDQPQTITPSAVIVQGEIEQLGDGRTVKTELEVPLVFANASFTRVKEDITPQKFKALVSETVEESTAAGTAAMPATLAPDEYEKSEQQATVFTKRTRTRKRTVGLENSFQEKVITPQGQLATRTLTLDNGPQTLTPSATLVDGEIEFLGDGRSVKTEIAVPAVFEGAALTRTKEDLTPAKFRAAVSETVEERTVAGTAAMPSTLGSNELEKSEQQATVFTKRTRTRSRTTTTTPTLTGQVFTTELGGGTASVIEEYGTSPIIAPGFGTVSAERENLGDGKFVTRSVVLTSPPELSGQIYDENLDIVVPYTQQTVPADNAMTVESPRTEIQPRDVHHSLRREVDVDAFRAKALAEYYKVGAAVNSTLPDTLESVEAIRATTYSYGNATAVGNNYSIRASGTASQTLDIRWRIKQGYTGPIPATRHVFFLDKDAALYSDILAKITANSSGQQIDPFPATFPEPVVVTTVGGSVTKEVSQSASFDYSSGNASTGNGVSHSHGLSTSITNIPPTLHGQINVATVDLSVTVAGGGATGGGTVAVNSTNQPSFTGAFAPNVIPATTPPAFPSGNFLLSWDVEAYKYSLVRVSAIVLHVSEYYINGGTSPAPLSFSFNNNSLLWDDNDGSGGGVAGYSATPSVTAVNEGGSVTWAIVTPNAADTVLYYTFAGTVTASDFTDSTSSGSVTVSNGAASVAKTVAQDAATEGSEQAILQVRTGSVTGPVVATATAVTINDTSVGVFAIQPNVTSVNEGGTVTWTVTATGFQGTLYYTNGGSTAGNDFTDSVNSGTVNITNGTGTITKTLRQDVTTEGSQTIIMRLRTGSTAGVIVATSPAVTVNDTSTGSAETEVQMAAVCGAPVLRQHSSGELCTEYLDETWSSLFRCKVVLQGRLIAPNEAAGYASQINGTIRLINPTTGVSTGNITVTNGSFRATILDVNRSTGSGNFDLGPFEVLSSNLTGPGSVPKFERYSDATSGVPFVGWTPDSRILVGLPTALPYDCPNSVNMPDDPLVQYSVLSVAPSAGEQDTRILTQTITGNFTENTYSSYRCGADLVAKLYSRDSNYDINQVSGEMRVRMANGLTRTINVSGGEYFIAKILDAARPSSGTDLLPYAPIYVYWSRLIHTAQDGKKTQLFFPEYYPEGQTPGAEAFDVQGPTRDNTILGWNEAAGMPFQAVQMSCPCRDCNA